MDAPITHTLDGSIFNADEAGLSYSGVLFLGRPLLAQEYWLKMIFRCWMAPCRIWERCNFPMWIKEAISIYTVFRAFS